MSLDHYDNLLPLFFEPRPVPTALLSRAERIAKRFAAAFQGDGAEISAYHPYSKIPFGKWLDRYAEALQAEALQTAYSKTLQDVCKVGEDCEISWEEIICKVPRVRVFLPLLRDDDLDELERRLGAEMHPCMEALYFMAGAYKRIHDVSDEKIVLQSLNRPTVAEALQEEPAHFPAPLSLFDQHRTTPTEQLELCRFFQERGIVGHSDHMTAFYRQIAEFCRGMESPGQICPAGNGLEEAVQVVGKETRTFRSPDFKERQPEDIALWVDHFLRTELKDSELNLYRFPLALWCIELKEKGWPVLEGNEPCTDLVRKRF